MHKRTQRVCNFLFALLLLLLFTLPGAYLNRVADEMFAAMAEAEQLALIGGDPASPLARLSVLYDRHSGRFRMFLDHGAVDAVGAAIAACTPLAEPDALIGGLHAVRAALSHLLGVESLSAENLL